MAGKNTAAFGIYPSRATAEIAVDQLVAAGFSQADVSVLMADNQGAREFAAEKNIGALAIPGVGPLIAAGPIMGALAGLGVGGAVGGLFGALVGMGIPEYEAKRYEGRVKDGGILLSVHCDTSEEISRAKEILKATGADDVASSGEKAVSTHGVDRGAGRVNAESQTVNRPFGAGVERNAGTDPIVSATNPTGRRI
jgi:hypothetical protein